jgi:DNA-binding CsgD family transcriptional regulator
VGALDGRPRLTPRQREVLSRVRRGLSNREIARELGIGEDGVKAHLARLYLRYGVRNRVQLVNAAATALDAGVDPKIRLATVRTMADVARQEMEALRPTNGDLTPKVDARIDSVRRALQALDITLELMEAMPPNTTGKALKVVRKHMTVALNALRDLETAVT